jgi:type VI secretion system protein ImpE
MSESMSERQSGNEPLLQASAYPIAEHITRVESSIRTQPANAGHRWALFQWLCVARQWERAIRQLQVFGQLDGRQVSLVHACRDLVRAERWREQVMRGQEAPGYVYDEAPEWMHGLIAALELTGKGELTAADDVRLRSLDAAPLVAGRADGTRFEWIADSDSRLGPVFEIISASSYRWVSLFDLSAWQISKPATLIDLVWSRCTLTFHDGTVIRGFTPARYVPASSGRSSDDALDLGQLTVWSESGRSGVTGDGRKTWTSSVGDIDIFELLECAFARPDPGPVGGFEEGWEASNQDLQ